MTNTTCPIWGTQACAKIVPPGQDHIHVDSPRAGGEYIVTKSAIPALEDYEDHLKVRLTSWLVERRCLGNPCPEIHSQTLKEIRQKKERRAFERADGILKYLETRSVILGTRINYRVPIEIYDNPDVDGSVREYFGLLSHSGCVSKNDLSFLLNYLDQHDLIENTVLDGGMGECTLTVEGYARLAELEETDIVSSKAFIAMKFNDTELDAFVKDVVKPTVRGFGYDLEDMRDVAQAGVIDNIMREQIREAAFVIADLTHDNSGAYWEAGYAEGLDKPVIYICEKTKFEEHKTHFDTNHCTTVPWSKNDPEGFRKKLIATLYLSLNVQQSSTAAP